MLLSALDRLARLHHSGTVRDVEASGDRVAAVSARPLSTSRRTALGGALAGAWALTACDVPDVLPGGEEPGGPGQGDPDPDPDTALVEEVRERITATDAVLAELLRQHPGLRGELRPLRRMHAAHARAIEGFGDRAPAGLGSVPRGQALATARRTEKDLQRALVRSAVRAESGALARLLASMAASVAQHLAATG